MGSNFHTEYSDRVTPFSADGLGGANEELDKAITYSRDKLISCAGLISWDDATGELSWGGAISIYFTREDGKAVKNIIEAASIVVADGQFAYVSLDEEDGKPIAVNTATPSTGQDSSFMAVEVLVLGYRSGGKFAPVALLAEFTSANAVEVFDPSLFYPGSPADAVVLLHIPITRACDFAADFSGSYAAARTAAAAESVFDIQKNGVSVGSITFAAAASVGTFVSTGNNSVHFNAGDTLTVVAPATADQTLADIGITLAGTR